MPSLVVSIPAPAVSSDIVPPRAVAVLTRDMARLKEDAWSEFHTRYFDRLYRYALTLHRGDHDFAEDSVQAAFLRAVKHIKTFQAEDVFWSWLTLLVRCAAADQGRKLTARSRLQDVLLAHEGWFNRRILPPGNETAFVLLEEALNGLTPEERRIMEEKYVHGQSTATLADRLQLTPKAVENRLRRLRKQLKATIHALSCQTRA